MKDALAQETINNISELIYETMKELEIEQKHPGADPDAMDDNLKLLKERYYKLCSIRRSLEKACIDVIV
jgi:hypothetical protein